MLTTLVPTLNRNSSPIPIPTFLGKDPVVRPLPSGDSKDSQGEGVFKDVDPAWSRGLGYELSPIKMRSARKKAGTNSSFSAFTYFF
jgi:hypothetical protein